MRLAGESVLHIKGVHVEFEEGFGANLSFDVLNSRHRTAADVIRDAAPAHGGPVDDPYAGNERARAFAANQLFERLDAIESSSGCFSGHHHFIRADSDKVSFVSHPLIQGNTGSFQSLLNSRQIDLAD